MDNIENTTDWRVINFAERLSAASDEVIEMIFENACSGEKIIGGYDDLDFEDMHAAALDQDMDIVGTSGDFILGIDTGGNVVIVGSDGYDPFVVVVTEEALNVAKEIA